MKCVFVSVTIVERYQTFYNYQLRNCKASGILRFLRTVVRIAIQSILHVTCTRCNGVWMSQVFQRGKTGHLQLNAGFKT